MDDRWRNQVSADLEIELVQQSLDELRKFLRGRRRLVLEGSATPEQLAYLMRLVRREDARLVAEVGFNAGFSSLAFLRSSGNVRVVSFDIGLHPYVADAKAYIDDAFPGRHELVHGDSRKTIPAYYEANQSVRFDLVFVDGGHQYEVARADLLNLQPLSRRGAAVVMDDVVPGRRWGDGPARAWNELVTERLIVEEELFQDGARVTKTTPDAVRAWALGRFRQQLAHGLAEVSDQAQRPILTTTAATSPDCRNQWERPGRDELGTQSPSRERR